MSFRELEWHAVEKLWGRRDFPSVFGNASQFAEPVGEIWFADDDASQLLVKYLFTSERLSIQVHPSDEQAQAAGLPSGKCEAWFVLSAEPGANVGIGFDRELSAEELRAVSLDGSIEQLLTWHEVKPGDIFYIPAGTVHAIGAGLSVLEIQQNADVTYRLYDYGRPRQLQLDEGIAASRAQPYSPHPARRIDASREVLVEGPKFVIERLSGAQARNLPAGQQSPMWLMPLADGCAVGGKPMGEGTVWLADEPAQLQIEDGSCVLVAYPGAQVLG